MFKYALLSFSSIKPDNWIFLPGFWFYMAGNLLI